MTEDEMVRWHHQLNGHESATAWIRTLGEVCQTRLSVPTSHQVDGVVLAGQRAPRSRVTWSQAPEEERPPCPSAGQTQGSPEHSSIRALGHARLSWPSLAPREALSVHPGTPASHASSTRGLLGTPKTPTPSLLGAELHAPSAARR